MSRLPEVMMESNQAMISSVSSDTGKSSSPICVKNVRFVGAPQGAFVRKRAMAAKIVVEEGNEPRTFSRLQNYPNPFNPTTVITYQIPPGGFVSFKVYDLLGREVATLVDGVPSTGIHNVAFDVSHIESGVCFYKLKSGVHSTIRKFQLVR